MRLGILSSTLQDDGFYLPLSHSLIYLSLVSVTRNSLRLRGGGRQLQSGRNIASARGMSFPARAKGRISPSQDV